MCFVEWVWFFGVVEIVMYVVEEKFVEFIEYDVFYEVCWDDVIGVDVVVGDVNCVVGDGGDFFESYDFKSFEL